VEVHGDVSPPAPGADAADPENTCEMVVNATIAPDSEIFNTYGAKLTNAELLVRYGFMLDANDNDTLTWTIEEIWDAAGAALHDLRPRRWDDHAGYGVCMKILRDWQYDAGWVDSELVIDTEPNENRNPLYMTADGVLSHKLWLAIALAALWRQGMTTEAAEKRQLLTRIAWAQIQMEQGQTESRKEGVDEDDDDAYEVREHGANVALLTLKMGKSNHIYIKLLLCWIHYRLEPLVRGQNACAPAFGDAESAGVGQADSHDRETVHAEDGSDFPYKRTTTGRSRSWPT
jgi:hypothetical protein